MSDKIRCHAALEGFGPFGTLQIVGTGDGTFEIVERRIIKHKDMTEEQKAAIEQIVKVLKSTTIRIISHPTAAGPLAPDRVEVLYLR